MHVLVASIQLRHLLCLITHVGCTVFSLMSGVWGLAVVDVEGQAQEYSAAGLLAYVRYFCRCRQCFYALSVVQCQV